MTIENTLNIKSKKIRLAFADGLRGLAALWVVLFHLAEGHHIDKLVALFPNTSLILFYAGHLGVAIFFVLSGFVMAHIMYPYQVNMHYAKRFLMRRLIRLSPPYYFAILVAISFLLLKSKLVGGDVHIPSLREIGIHMLYAQDYAKLPPINMAFWTLGVEVQFYFAFVSILFLADWLKNRFNVVDARLYVLGASAFISLAWAFNLIHTKFWPGGFIIFWYSFMAGVLVSFAISTSKKAYANLSLAITFLIFIAGVLKSDPFILMVAFTALVLLYANYAEKMESWLSWGWLQALGLISYSLYLLHSPITGASANLIRRFLPINISTDVIVMFVAIINSLIAAWLAFIIIEKPSINWSHLSALPKKSDSTKK
ncbi:MAG TPA: acyltransferase [Methylotenera sp.]|nr:acyltransferase [Methylotenera sp.]